jgi:hypothetical protein
VQIKAGSRWRSAVCDTEVIVVRAPKDEVDLACGGAALVAYGEDVPAGLELDPDSAGGSLLGKRYADETVGIELLCTKPGAGSLSVNGVPLPLKDAKPLPASD